MKKLFLPCGHRAWLIHGQALCPFCSSLAGADTLDKKDTLQERAVGTEEEEKERKAGSERRVRC